MVFLELFRQYGIFGTVQTVWYFWNSSDSMVFFELFRQYGILGNCSDSIVFLKLFRQHEIFGTVQTIWYFLSAHVNILPL
jgi:hypothetical protein